MIDLNQTNELIRRANTALAQHVSANVDGNGSNSEPDEPLVAATTTNPQHAERYIRDYLESCGGGRGDIRDIIDQIIALARSDKLAYEQLRNDIAKACKIRTSVLDQVGLGKPEVTDQNVSGSSIVFVDPQPWPEAVDGAVLLDEIAKWLTRYVVLPAGAARVVAAWAVATWFVNCVYIAPVLTLLSPSKRCGKTLLLDLLSRLVRRPLPTSGAGVTTASIFRACDEFKPCLLVDEAERLNNPANADLVALLNAGHRRGGKVLRCVGDENEVRAFDAFGFRALAAIGKLPGTILDRSIIVTMQRKAQNQQTERFSARQIEQEASKLVRKIARFAADHESEIADAEEKAPRPTWLNDRACDNYAALFAVANLAGGWVGGLLEASRTLEADREQQDYSEQLIRDINETFTGLGNPEVIQSGDLVERLKAIEESPWPDYRGGLTSHRLAAMLRGFGIKSRHQYCAALTKDVRGYWLEDFQGIFDRYSQCESVRSVRSQKNQEVTGNQSVRSSDTSNDANLLRNIASDTSDTSNQAYKDIAL